MISLTCQVCITCMNKISLKLTNTLKNPFYGFVIFLLKSIYIRWIMYSGYSNIGDEDKANEISNGTLIMLVFKS